MKACLTSYLEALHVIKQGRKQISWTPGKAPQLDKVHPCATESARLYVAPSCAALGGLLCMRLELCCNHLPDIVDCQGDVCRVLIDQHLRELPLHNISYLIIQLAQSR